MTSPRDQVVTAILALNRPDVPFVWSATPTGVSGTWNHADAAWAGPLAAGSVDATFRTEVELREDATYTLTDHTEQTSARGGLGGLSVERSSFRGTVRKVSFGTGAAPVARDHGTTGNTYGWDVDSAHAKAPLRDVLGRHGWTERKVGFWARLLGGGA